MHWNQEHFEACLVGRKVEALTTTRQAAVAALIRFDTADDPEVLLMRRADREGDPWSGQISFPGGKREEFDVDLLATAHRETREELGFDLAQVANYLGPLDPLHAMSKGKRLSTAIEPFVFVQTEAPEIVMNEEAVDTFWIPLRSAQAGELDCVYPYRSDSHSIDLPAWRFQEQVIWGLTFQMLKSMLKLLSC